MTLRFLRDETTAVLRGAIEANLERYRSGEFDYLDFDSSHYHELPVPVVDDALGRIKMPSADDYYEADNCIAVHGYLHALSPYEARDERLWCYLTHRTFLSYVRARWPIPDDDAEAIGHIERHFFARTNRQIERDNAIARLWWMAHLCTRVPSVPQRQALDAFLYRADVRANIIERPTVAQSTNVFAVILKGLVASASGQKALFERATFRKVMMELNSIGGFKLLDALPEQEVNAIFSDVVVNRVGLASL